MCNLYIASLSNCRMAVSAIVITVLSLFMNKSFGQQSLVINASSPADRPMEGHIRQGTNKDNHGNILSLNSRYFIKNDKPWYPVMGEFHFSRYPVERWEEAVLRMKAAGIDVIATYTFWIHHQEKPGAFNWKGNKDLRLFLDICAKHKMYVWLRIGPWCHGEVRNGGLPDYIVKAGNTRRNDEAYLQAVSGWFDALSAQTKGYMFKDGGPVIGAQIENEYRFNNPAGLSHILKLKQMAVDRNIDVPYYSATGWPGSDQKQRELVLVWGAYPEAPWDKRTEQLKLSGNYLFGPLSNDPSIGADLLGAQDQQKIRDSYPFPYATAEMGAGNQITYHRRPLISSADVTAMAYVKAGSGANLMGYYMFHGGSNPIGDFSTMQESRATKYPNDYPLISYDFQSPIGEAGQLRDSYKDFKLLHYFLNDFGDQLAPMHASFPADGVAEAGDVTKPRLSLRSKDSCAFLFVSNYQRQLELPAFRELDLTIKLPDSHERRLGSSDLNIVSGLQAVFPINMPLGRVALRWASLQPFCLLRGAIPTYVFFIPKGQDAHYVLNGDHIRRVVQDQVAIKAVDGEFRIAVSGDGSMIEIVQNDGKKLRILSLTESTARDCWKLSGPRQDYLVHANLPPLLDAGSLSLIAESAGKHVFSVFPDNRRFRKDRSLTANRGIIPHFHTYGYHVKKDMVTVEFSSIDDIKTLPPAVASLPEDDRLTPRNAEQPGPVYQTNLRIDSGARYFRIRIPACEQGERRLLQIDYSGDTGALYEQGRLIADDFYSGLPFIVDAGHGGGREFILEILPWDKRRKVFFEHQVKARLDKAPAALLKGVSMKVLQKKVLQF